MITESGMEIIGSLNPEKEYQDRVRVFGWGGISCNQGNGLQRPTEDIDREIMLGLLDPNGYERVNRVYSADGLSPTVTASDYKDPIKVVIWMFMS